MSTILQRLLFTTLGLCLAMLITGTINPAAAQCGGVAPTAGDFRSVASASWNLDSTWETFDGATWMPAASVPDGTLTTEHTSICDGTVVSVPSSTTVTVGGLVTVEADGGSGGGELSGFNIASVLSFIGTTFTNLGAVTVDDFDMNGTSQSLQGAGTWSVNDFVITGSSTTTLGSDVTLANNTNTINSGGTLALDGNTLTIDGTVASGSVNNNGNVSGSGSVQFSGTASIDPDGTGGSGSFSADVEIVDGTTTGNTGTLAGDLTIDSGAAFTVASSNVVTHTGDAVIDGTLTGNNTASTYVLGGSSFTNGATGAVTIDDFDVSSAAATLQGDGLWDVNDFVILGGATVTLGTDVTFANNTNTINSTGALALGAFDLTIDGNATTVTLNNNGTVSGSGTVMMTSAGAGPVTLDPDGSGGTGSFSADVEIVDGTTTGSQGALAGDLTIDSGATLTVASSNVVTHTGDAIINGTLTGNNTASTYVLGGSSFTNGATGAVTIDDFDVTSAAATLQGDGAWTVNDFVILAGATVTLGTDVTFANNTNTINSTGTLALGGNALTIDGNVATGSVNNNGNVSGSGSVQFSGTTSIDPDGTGGTGSFSADVEIVDGTTTGSQGTLAGDLTIDSGAAFTVASSNVVTHTGDAIINGTLTGNNTASTYVLGGSSFTNGATGAVTIDDFDVSSAAATLQGSGLWDVNDFVILAGATVTLGTDVTFANNTTTINGGGALALDGNALTIDGTAATGSVNNNGDVSGSGSVQFSGTASIDPDGTGGTGSFNADVEIVDGTTTGTQGTLAGDLTIDSGAAFTVASSNVVTHTGDALINGTLAGNNTASTYVLAGSSFTNGATGAITIDDFDVSSAAATLQGNGLWDANDFVILSGAVVTLGSDVTFANNTTTVNNGGELSTATFTLDLDGGVLTGADGSLISGEGTVDFSSETFNSDGDIGPGASPGILTLVGAYDHSFADFEIELDNSTTPGTGHDQVAVDGTANLTSGVLNVSVSAGYAPNIDDEYTVLTCSGGCSNTFSSVNLPAGYEADVMYNANDVVLKLTLVPLAELSLTKAVDNDVVNVGTDVTFTVTLNNSGPEDATGVQVTDLLPAGLAFVSATASQGTYTDGDGLWDVGALANGSAATLDVTATVNQAGLNTNTASITATDQADGDSGNNTDSADVTGLEADLGVDKVVDMADANVGTDVTFTVTLNNDGPSDATGVQVTDLLPAGLAFVSATASQGTYTDGDGLWDVGALANGSAATLDITATVNQAGTITNTAAITAADQPDPNADNDSDSADVNGMEADLGVDKVVDNPAPLLGDDVVFTITLNNDGPSDATGVQVTDLLPAGLAFVSATASQGTYTDGDGLWDAGALANGSAATLDITATVTETGAITNTAAVTASDQADPNADNDSDDAMVAAGTPTADLGVDKVVDMASVDVGTDVTFTITLNNSGPEDATGVQVTDLLPAGLAFVSATASQGTYTDGDGLWDVGALANGSAATLDVTATVNQAGLNTNTAAITAADQADPNGDNNSDDATVTGNEDDPMADLGIDKAVDMASVEVGTDVTFTVTLSNDGPDDATGVQVTDLLPAGLAFVSATASQGTYTDGDGLWDVGALANGSAATLDVTATVTQTGTITNTAAVTAADQPDPNADNDSDSADVEGTVEPTADLGVDKEVDMASVDVGTDVTFTVTLSNDGPDDATGVQVTDLLPAGLAFVSATASQGTYTDGDGLWDVGALANGSAATLDVTATVNQAGLNTNTAAITAADQADPNADNDSDSADVEGVEVSAFDVVVVPVSPPAEVPAEGGCFDFDLTITNQSGIEQTVQVWANVTDGDGNELRSFSPITTTFAVGQQKSLTKMLCAPASLMAGTYDFTMFVGTFPSDVLGQGSLSFTKLGGVTKRTHVDSWSTDLDLSSDADGAGGVPTTHVLEQNYPNPFNPTTTIRFGLPEATDIHLAIYDVMGREVRRLAAGTHNAGTFSVTWDGLNAAGMRMPSGVYFYRLEAGASVQTRSLTLLK